jgi:outer membrane murein-binding lipoprotein Lpp
MKRMLALCVVAVISLGGCASGKFLGFIATTDYVDAKAKELQDQQASEIAQLRAQLAEYQAIRDQAQAAIQKVDATQKTIEDLQTLAQRAEARIGSIPKEVIGMIVDILQAALQETTGK